METENTAIALQADAVRLFSSPLIPGQASASARRPNRKRDSNVSKEIESPCVSLCKLKGDVCTGCGRTRAEIKEWKGMKHKEQKATVERAAMRMKAFRKKGRKG